MCRTITSLFHVNVFLLSEYLITSLIHEMINLVIELQCILKSENVLIQKMLKSNGNSILIKYVSPDEDKFGMLSGGQQTCNCRLCTCWNWPDTGHISH